MVKSFGIEEMAALAGGSQTEDMAAFRPSVAGPQLANKKKKLPNEEPDFSTMSAAETAALLMEKNSSSKNANVPSSRYRTNRRLAHHALAQELSEEMQIRQVKEQQQAKQRGEDSTNDNEDGSDFQVVDYKRAARRKRAAPQIISQSQRSTTNGPSATNRRKRRSGDDDSASTDSSDGSNKCPRRRVGRRRRETEDDSSSSSDGEDRRRERLQASRKRQGPQVIQTVASAPPPPIKQGRQADAICTGNVDALPQPEIPPAAAGKAESSKRKPSTSSSEDENGSESGSSVYSSSSEDESSSEENAVAKPVFVPRNKRNLLQSEEKKWEEEELRAEREKERAERRKMESRAMVAETVAAVQSANFEEDTEVEGGGATNAPPNDDDDINREKEQDAWEVRELRRLLQAMDEMKRREKEKLEYERRRQMTDEEVFQHDKKAGRYQAPGSNRDGQPTGKYMQRFYHRGAFYMAEDEWDKDDIRHRAADYAKAATGEDKVDKSALPEVMQVKGFGFARQNTRYKGLAKEDTTDKRQGLLPLVHTKNK